PAPPAVWRGGPGSGWRTRHRAGRAPPAQPLLSGALRPRSTAVRRVRRAPPGAGERTVLHRLRGRARTAARYLRGLWPARHRPGGPWHEGAPESNPLRPVEDGLRHYPGGTEAPR